MAINEWSNIPHSNYRSYLQFLAKKKASYLHQIEVLKARKVKLISHADLIQELKTKIAEIEHDYKELDHRL